MNENENSGSDERNNTFEGTSSTTTSSSTAKEKRSWFHSLTRRKKSQSQTSLIGATPRTTSAEPLFQNNNNEPLDGVASATAAAATIVEDLACASTSRKRKDEKNVFQRFRKKMGLRFNSLRQRRHVSDDDDDDVRGGAGGTTDASSEFLTHSPIREPQLTFSFNHSDAVEEPELGQFTRDYKRFIVKKWLEGEGGPNHVMYKACCEMLSQVWYWGEISRSDAQKQLTDKPTGSFLVRDSETSGCKYTLSFRILNVTLHYRLEYHQNYWHFEELQYDSIVEMIENIIFRCTNDNFVCFVKVPNEMQPPIPVILRYPLSRYSKMPLLQDLCRRVIQRHHTTPEAILKLPVPPKLVEYLTEKRELIFQC